MPPGGSGILPSSAGKALSFYELRLKITAAGYSYFEEWVEQSSTALSNPQRPSGFYFRELGLLLFPAAEEL